MINRTRVVLAQFFAAFGDYSAVKFAEYFSVHVGFAIGGITTYSIITVSDSRDSGFESPERIDMGVSKRCRLSCLSNSAFVYEPNCGGIGGVAGSQPMSTAVHRIPNKTLEIHLHI
jgi:hypothetical protein